MNFVEFFFWGGVSITGTHVFKKVNLQEGVWVSLGPGSASQSSFTQCVLNDFIQDIGLEIE